MKQLNDWLDGDEFDNEQICSAVCVFSPRFTAVVDGDGVVVVACLLLTLHLIIILYLLVVLFLSQCS